jgi:hypothetical protein
MTENKVFEKLSNLYGFRVPRDFVKILLHVYAAAPSAADDSATDSNFLYYLNFMFDLEGAIAKEFFDYSDWEDTMNWHFAYVNFPFELFPFGGPGIDGISYGFVVHAPELEAEDYPVGEFCPADGEGVFRLGENTRRGFEFMIARALKHLSPEAVNAFYENKLTENDQIYWADYRKRARRKAEGLAKLLDIDPFNCKVEKKYRSRKVKPKIPKGWRLETSWDGIGALAPKDKFAPDFGHSDIPDFENIDEELNFVRDFLRRGFPATALWVMRENYWDSSFNEKYFAQLAPLWAESYEALNRPLLAERVFAALEKRK